MAAVEEWLAAGRDALLADGAPGVRIDKLAARLGATKGSFYHHFDGVAGFRRALLTDLEHRLVGGFIDAVEAGGGTARDRLDRLMGLVLDVHARESGGGLEVAVRAWAAQNDDAHETQARIDRVRADYLRELWSAIAATGPQPHGRGGTGGDLGAVPGFDAQAAAWLVHCALVGSRHLVPALDTAALRRMFGLIQGLPPRGDDQ